MYVLLLEAVLLVNNPRLPYNCVPCRSIPGVRGRWNVR